MQTIGRQGGQDERQERYAGRFCVRLAAGSSLEDACAPYLTDEAFEAWYRDFGKALQDAVH